MHLGQPEAAVEALPQSPCRQGKKQVRLALEGLLGKAALETYLCRHILPDAQGRR